MTARTNLVRPTPIADLVPKRPALVHGVVVVPTGRTGGSGGEDEDVGAPGIRGDAAAGVASRSLALTSSGSLVMSRCSKSAASTRIGVRVFWVRKSAVEYPVPLPVFANLTK